MVRRTLGIGLLSLLFSTTAAATSSSQSALPKHGSGDIGPAPPRWWCGERGGLTIEDSSPTNISATCATAHQFLAEVNRYSAWEFVYAGPDSAGWAVMLHVDPRDTAQVLGRLRILWMLTESSRDPNRQQIYLRPTERFIPGKPEPMLRAPDYIPPIPP